ncbi:hypothetical protein [Flavobacterium sp. CAU 1735]|uniref:hypothetical protein n=1 Tax=Flavobacterium sp. CAU 1735 TaxID=3140361 RepID=UPI0032619B14
MMFCTKDKTTYYVSKTKYMVKLKLSINFLFFLSLTCFSQVGINTDTPEATLDINGNLKISNVRTVSSGSNVSSLVIDKNTKEVKVMSLGNETPIKFLTYQLHSVDGDLVKNFNTNIGTSEFSLIVTGSSYDSGWLYTHEKSVYGPKNVYAYKEGGTWRLYADYFSAYNGTDSGWVIYCLVINKGVVNELPTISVQMNGQETGSANSPIGL